MKQLIGLSCLFLCNLAIGQGRVDGFSKGEGNLDIALGANFETNKNYFAGTNKISLARDILSANLFTAYGITNNLDVNFSVPFVSVNGVESSIQDLALFFKYKVLSKNVFKNTKEVTFTSKYLGKISFLLAGGVSSNITDYQTEGGNAIGQQAKALDIRPVVHLTYGNYFLTIQGGYNYKFDPVANSVPFAFKLGIAKTKYYLDIWYDSQYGIGGLDYQGTPTPLTFRELGVSFHKIGGTFYRPIKPNLGVFGGLSYTITGRNVSQGVGIGAGIVLKYNKK